MPGQRSTATAGQKGKAVAQIGGHLLNPQHGSVSGGELYREWYAIQMPANRGDGRKLAALWREFGGQGPCSGDE